MRAHLASSLYLVLDHSKDPNPSDLDGILVFYWYPALLQTRTIFSYTENTIPPLNTNLPNLIVLPAQNPNSPLSLSTLFTASIVPAPATL